MRKILVTSLVFFSSFFALAGGIVCTTKNVLGFPDQYTIAYQPGPAGIFDEILFERCEAAAPGAPCDFKLEKSFDSNVEQTIKSWPIGVYSARAVDNSSITININKKDGVDAEYEGAVYMTSADGGYPWEFELACNTLE